jgi:hypothetical protein
MTSASERDPGTDAARTRVADLFEGASRVNLGVVVVAPPDATREAARDAATDAAIVAGRSALLREATAAAREIVLKSFSGAGFSGTWAVTEMSLSVASASDRVAAVAAFEEATIAAVAEDLVDADTVDILRLTWDEISSSRAIPSPGALSSIASTASRVDRSPIQVAIVAGVVLVCALIGFAAASYAGLIAVFLAVGLLGALTRRSSPPVPWGPGLISDEQEHPQRNQP